MSKEVRLSKNELSTLLKSFFQGIFRHDQDFTAMAETVLWLEIYGFGGIEILVTALDEKGLLAPFLGEIEKAPNGYHIDGKGGSLVVALHMVADLSSLQTEDGTSFQITLENFKDMQALSAIHSFNPRTNPADFPQYSDRLQALSQEQISYAQSCLNEGITIARADYEVLVKTASLTLVEDSETSRKGAGE